MREVFAAVSERMRRIRAVRCRCLAGVRPGLPAADGPDAGGEHGLRRRQRRVPASVGAGIPRQGRDPVSGSRARPRAGARPAGGHRRPSRRSARYREFLQTERARRRVARRRGSRASRGPGSASTGSTEPRPSTLPRSRLSRATPNRPGRRSATTPARAPPRRPRPPSPGRGDDLRADRRAGLHERPCARLARRLRPDPGAGHASGLRLPSRRRRLSRAGDRRGARSRRARVRVRSCAGRWLVCHASACARRAARSGTPP